MAVWSSNNIMLTQKGQELLSKVQAGIGQLTITRVVTGSGRVSTSSLFTQTEVSSIKQTMVVTKVTTMSTGSNLELQVTNANLSTSYNINQIGVYATHPDMGEVLYMIAQCDEGTADIMPLPAVTPVTMNYMFYLIHGSATNLNITVDPAGLVSVATFNEHLEEFRELCDFVGYNDEQVYGVEIDYENKTYKRLGANVGLNPSDFDALAPWGGRRRCNVTDEGVVLAYYGETGYSETGALTESITKDGVTYPVGTFVQVMVEQPKFWYKTVPVKMEKQINQSGYSLCKARYYISLTPRPGFKVFPLFTRGIPLIETDVAYLPAYRGSIYDVSEPVVEVVGMEVLSAPNSEGNITLTMDGFGEVVTIAVTANDTAEDVASRIAAHSFKDWIVYKEGTTIKFTAKKAGARSKCIFTDTDNTGTSCNFDYPAQQVGAGGYIENDAQVADFTENTGDMLCSIAGVKPASGLTQNLTRKNVSVLAKNRNYDPKTQTSRFTDGFGWQQKDLAANHCTAWLHLIEYATLDCKTTIGKGVVSITDDSSLNLAYKNGDTTTLGNMSGSAPNGIDGMCSVTYRGEENSWGNGNYWEEGLNIEAKGKNDAFYSVTGIYTDDVGEDQEGYKSTGFSITKSKGFADRVGYSEDFDWGFLATRTTGSSNSPIHGVVSTNPNYDGWFTSFRYCFWHIQVGVGLCSRNLASASENRNRYFGGCLMFVPEPKGTPVTTTEES